ncbi:MAG: glycosyltransferase family 2 protein [Calditrichota bacterium]
MNSTIPKVAAIVVNWNGRDLLREALASLFNSDCDNLSVIVVDNGSSDGSAALVRDEFPKATLISNDRNLGFAAGNNQGFERALALGAKYVFILNNDAIVHSSTISRLVSFLESRPQAWAVSPYIFYYHQRDLIWFGGARVNLRWGWIAHRHIRRRFNPAIHLAAECDYLTGCACLLRAEAVTALGGFNLEYGLYSEDVDLCLRLRKRGGELWVEPAAQAWHRVSASSGGELTPRKAFYKARSNALLLRRYSSLNQWPTMLAGLVLANLGVTLRLLAHGRFNSVIGLWRGLGGGIVPRKDT